MQQIFDLSSILVMPFWALMILLPHWRWSRRILSSLWVIAPAALLYVILILPAMPAALPLLIQPSLDGVAGLLGQPAGATVGWVHFLAFDLFVGRWIYLDSRHRNLSAWIASPILALTLMFGPFGFLLYLVVTQLTGSGSTARLAASR